LASSVVVIHLRTRLNALVGDGGDPTRGIGQAGPKAPYTGIVVYFPVHDVDSALARSESLGGTRVHRPRRKQPDLCSR